MKTGAERFWDLVRVEGDCWIWAGPWWGTSKGRHSELAAREAWRLAVGPMPNGWSVIRSCGEARCVRPEHHWLANPRDAVEHARRCYRQKYGRLVPEPRRKVTVDQVRLIRRLHRERVATLAQLALVHGLSREGVRDIVRRRTWEWVKD